MKSKNQTDLLDEKILELEAKRDHELYLLKEQFHEAYESIKPVNIIKNAIHEVVTSPDMKNNVAGNALSLGVGFLSKKILVGKSHNPIKRFLGNLFQFAITNVVAKHSDSIISEGSGLLNRYMNHKKD